MSACMGVCVGVFGDTERSSTIPCMLLLMMSQQRAIEPYIHS